MPSFLPQGGKRPSSRRAGADAPDPFPAEQLSLSGLAPFLNAPDLFLQSGALPEIPLIRLKARLTPFFYLRREDTFAGAVLPEFGFVERVSLQNDQELVLGAPAFGLLSVSGSGFAFASHFFSPFRQGHIGDSALLCQTHDGNVLRRHHLPDKGFLEFRAVSFHFHRTSRVSSHYTFDHSDQAASLMTPVVIDLGNKVRPRRDHHMQVSPSTREPRPRGEDLSGSQHPS